MFCGAGFGADFSALGGGGGGFTSSNSYSISSSQSPFTIPTHTPYSSDHVYPTPPIMSNSRALHCPEATQTTKHTLPCAQP